ncbi:acetyltransferase (GNAT) domain protein [Bacteriovorax sp. BAL6_X]|uniref:GNAT family N-acetyltransferase n=1 Tax=Bacteriovorax sp. BAL6_X TaxID=1201290 RepID=UPI000385E823|nr:GNAT family N-acetyltransferase [Bacteriovorax sp. BAL6_X]EPZ50531.1 acetyltransferase (GNAT) domain protein [Bacteriovorax sp. BAL6_X]
MFNFKEISENDLELVLKWRTSEHVTKFMNTDIQNSIENQKKWFKAYLKNDEYKFWIINYDNKRIGSIYLDEKDMSWGFYIGEKKYTLLGPMVLPYFYNYIFLDRYKDLEYIDAEVFKNNKAVIKIHNKHGYEKLNNEYKVIKSDKEIVLCKYRLFKSSWLALEKKYKRFRADFP